MLIPIGHENMTARRLPVITFALILINILAFLATKDTLEKEAVELEELRAQILLLAAMDPELEIPPEAEPLISSLRDKHPEDWEEVKKHGLALVAEWGLDTSLTENHGEFQEKLDSLAKDYGRLAGSAMVCRYAFVPSDPNPIAYLTANFLHAGWLHLIGNLWFLWLAGFVLEDAWGRFIYLASYLVAGAAAIQFHAWTNAGSTIPTLGASGAVAALMGAFLIRFPKIKIEMVWVFLIFRVRRFQAKAYWLLPLWLLTEIFYGTLTGGHGGVAHWAHVGGFLFGAMIAMALGVSGIEHKVNASIEKQISGNCDPELVRAQEYVDHRKFSEAIAVLQTLTAARPASLDAWMLLRDVCWQKQDIPTYQQAALKCCELHLRAHNDESAWRDYEDYANSGGKQLPLSIRFDLCRLLDNRGDSEIAVSEYERLAADHPSARQALMAQLAAGKICMKKLNRPQEALKFYEAAASSPVPHLDLEETIQSAIHEAKAALAFLGAEESSPGAIPQSRT